MKKDLTYRKNFTELAGVQKAKILDYSLFAKKEDYRARYCILVQETTCEGSRLEQIELPVVGETTAADILTYLSENVVPFVHCREIISNMFQSVEVGSSHEQNIDPIANC